jgi:hypothetical protein
LRTKQGRIESIWHQPLAIIGHFVGNNLFQFSPRAAKTSVTPALWGAKEFFNHLRRSPLLREQNNDQKLLVDNHCKTLYEV